MAARSFSIYDRVKYQSSLWAAWRHVRENGLKSKSRPNRTEVQSFDHEAPRQIASIYRRLHASTFRFRPATAVRKKRPGKQPRPIIVAPLENRIVQRSILNALKDEAAMKKYFSVRSSYGTRGAPSAIEEAYRLLTSGRYAYFIRSDIEGFFTRIPRSTPLAAIADLIPEVRFNALLHAATDSELGNLESLGEDAELFPDEEYGVAQGCALSSLLGDVLLYDFDLLMNDRGVRCLRYVDDFLILGPNERYTRKAFESAQDHLGTFGLRAYDPVLQPDKAACGNPAQGFAFLGCEVLPGIVRPTRKKKEQMLQDIDEVLDDSYAAMATPLALQRYGGSLVEALSVVDRRVRAWGNQYQFCNDRLGFDVLDQTIDKKISKYLARYVDRRRACQGTDAARDQRRILGIQLLTDCNRNPIPERGA